MKFSEVGFRAFYHNFIVIPMKDNLRDVLKDFPGADRANCILTYGYIDRMAGLTLEVLAAAFMDNEEMSFGDGNAEKLSKIRIESVIDDECYYIDDEDCSMYKLYSDKLDMLKNYAAGDGVEESRNMVFLYSLRSPEYPDDVLVYLLKNGNKPEGCWVRIEALAEHAIIGTLLNEPSQDFGYHAGSQIAFYVHQTENKEIILCSNLD